MIGLIVTDDYFKTIGSGVSNMYCTNNKFNYDMYSFCAKNFVLLDVVGNLPQGRYRVCHLKNLHVKKDEHEKNDPNSFYNLSEEMSKAVQHELEDTGISLDVNYYKTHSRFLSALFLLTSLCLVVVESKDKTGYSSYLATKNDVVLNRLMHNKAIRPEDMRKDLQKYKDKCSLTADEIDGSKLHVIKLSIQPGSGTLKLGAATIYPNSKKTTVFPFFMARMYVQKLLNVLKTDRFKITYLTGNETKEVYTTLKRKDLYDKAVIETKKDMSKLAVYDFNKAEFISICITDIVSLVKA